MKNSTVFLLDDHEALRDGLALMLNGIAGLEVVGRGTSGNDLVAATEKGIIPDLLLLDLNMPEMDGYETAKWLKANYPQVKILVLTMYNTEVAVIRILQEGVKGIVKKEINADDLIDAVQKILKGEYYFCSATTGTIAAHFTAGKREPEQQGKLLSETEISVLRLCASDMAYKEIAEELEMSFTAVDNIRRELFEKLKIRTRTGLALYALKNGIAHF